MGEEVGGQGGLGWTEAGERLGVGLGSQLRSGLWGGGFWFCSGWGLVGKTVGFRASQNWI